MGFRDFLRVQGLGFLFEGLGSRVKDQSLVALGLALEVRTALTLHNRSCGWGAGPPI